MRLNEQGITHIILIIILSLLFILWGWYFFIRTSPLVPKISPFPSKVPTKTAAPAMTTQPQYHTSSVTSSTPEPLPKSSLPADFPVYSGSVSAHGGPIRMKSCNYGQSDKFCEVNSFIFHIPEPASVDSVKNWYVGNPNPSWVFGTGTFTQANAGRLVNGDTYYIVRIANLFDQDAGVQLTIEGPYKN